MVFEPNVLVIVEGAQQSEMQMQACYRICECLEQLKAEKEQTVQILGIRGELQITSDVICLFSECKTVTARQVVDCLRQAMQSSRSSKCLGPGACAPVPPNDANAPFFTSAAPMDLGDNPKILRPVPLKRKLSNCSPLSCSSPTLLTKKVKPTTPTPTPNPSADKNGPLGPFLYNGEGKATTFLNVQEKFFIQLHNVDEKINKLFVQVKYKDVHRQSKLGKSLENASWTSLRPLLSCHVSQPSSMEQEIRSSLLQPFSNSHIGDCYRAAVHVENMTRPGMIQLECCWQLTSCARKAWIETRQGYTVVGPHTFPLIDELQLSIESGADVPSLKLTVPFVVPLLMGSGGSA